MLDKFLIHIFFHSRIILKGLGLINQSNKISGRIRLDSTLFFFGLVIQYLVARRYFRN